MPVTGLTTFVASQPVLASEMLGNLEAVRNWLNGNMVIGDFAAAQVGPEHILRPESFPAPANLGAGQLQHGSSGYVGPDGAIRHRYQRNRIDLFPESLRANDYTPITGKTIYAPNQGKVIVCATFDAAAYSDPGIGLAPHPTASGRFVLRWRRRDTGVEVTMDSGRRRLYAALDFPYVLHNPTNRRFHVLAVMEDGKTPLPAGYHDFYLAYRRHLANVNTKQVTVAVRAFTVEYYPS